MTETTDRATTAPGWDDAPLPKRNGHKGMLPSTWLGRALRVEYADASGKPSQAAGTLLDWYPAGPVLNVGGARTVVCWERICSIELAEEGDTA